MPTYRSVTLSLISQYDVLTIPEYAPSATAPDPFTDPSDIPDLVDSSAAVVSVYIPIYPSSQFWLSYKISPPYPPGLLYYFKLFVDGNCVVSWGCGREDGYQGKTMFGLFSAPGGRGIERRILAYGPPVSEERMPEIHEDFIEVKVYRSKGRKRVMQEIHEYAGQGIQGLPNESKKTATIRRNRIDLVNAGFLRKGDPQRYYKYALLDPLDRPFSTFRYYYRTWNQLEASGIILSAPTIDSSSIETDMKERAASPKSSLESTSSAEELVNTSRDPALTHHDSSSSEEPIRLYPVLEDDLTSNLPSQESTDELFATATTQQCRPGTPPKRSYGADKVTFMPTATGLIPTNIDLNSISPARLASIKPRRPTSSSSSLLTIGHHASKENFASLVRNHLPSPNPDNFKLIDLPATIEKTSSRRSSPPPGKARTERNALNVRALRNVFGRDNLRLDQPPKISEDTVSESSDSTEGMNNGSSARKGKASSKAKSGCDENNIALQNMERGSLAERRSDQEDDAESSRENEKSKEKEKEKQRTSKENEWDGRGRSRSRSTTRTKTGERRKLNLWEMV